MKMANEQRIAAPRQRVWEALNDPQILRASIPGCQSLDREADDRFAAMVEVRVGPIGARFKGTVSLADPDPPNGYTLHLEGNGGIAGSVKGSAKVRLREAAGGTLIAYEVDAQVGGRMAQLGGPVIDATAKQLAGKFFDRFAATLAGAEGAEPAGTNVAAPAALAAPSLSRGLPLISLLAVVVAALAGFLAGRGGGGAGFDWAGPAVGLLIVIVAGAAFEYGRRIAK
jgi:uncharacterized protein